MNTYRTIPRQARIHVIEVRPDGSETLVGTLPSGTNVRRWIDDYRQAAEAIQHAGLVEQ